MEEVSNNIDVKLKKKQKSRAIKRGVLVVLNALLGCYFVYSVTGAIMRYCEQIDDVNPANYIRVGELNKNESEEKYKAAIKYDSSVGYITEEATSFIYYGGYLNFRNCNDIFSKEGNLNHSSYSRYVLRNLLNNREYEKTLDFEVNTALNSGIPLFSENIQEGTYVVFSNDNYKSDSRIPLKINSEKGIYETFYSPSIRGVRRKIEIRSNSVSPCLVINIKDVLDVPSSYVDINVMTSDENKEKVKNVLNNTDYKVNYVNEAHERIGLINLKEYDSPYTVIVEDGNDIVVSSFVNIEGINKSSLIEEGSLKGLDEDVYIRELGGDVFCAGYGYSYNNGENTYLSSYIDDINPGSLVIKIGVDRIDELPNILKKL